jgi:hypothetical protein
MATVKNQSRQALCRQITDWTGVADDAGLDALIEIMRELRPPSVIAAMSPKELKRLVHRAVGVWADRDWPRGDSVTPAQAEAAR